MKVQKNILSGWSAMEVQKVKSSADRILSQENLIPLFTG